MRAPAGPARGPFVAARDQLVCLGEAQRRGERRSGGSRARRRKGALRLFDQLRVERLGRVEPPIELRRACRADLLPRARPRETERLCQQASIEERFVPIGPDHASEEPLIGRSATHDRKGIRIPCAERRELPPDFGLAPPTCEELPQLGLICTGNARPDVRHAAVEDLLDKGRCLRAERIFRRLACVAATLCSR